MVPSTRPAAIKLGFIGWKTTSRGWSEHSTVSTILFVSGWFCLRGQTYGIKFRSQRREKMLNGACSLSQIRLRRTAREATKKKPKGITHRTIHCTRRHMYFRDNPHQQFVISYRRDLKSKYNICNRYLHQSKTITVNILNIVHKAILHYEWTQSTTRYEISASFWDDGSQTNF